MSTLRAVRVSVPLCAALALFQIAQAQRTAAPSTRGPVAYVYVTSTPANSSTNQIVAYAATPNGQLNPVLGSPFAANVNSMAVNGLYLFGVEAGGAILDAYNIQSDGSLTPADYTNITSGGNACANAGRIFLDRTGATLYGMVFNDDECSSNNDYRSFAVVKSNGGLEDLGVSGPNDWLYLPASFTGNNQYAYTASCLGNMYWGIWGYERQSNGLLASLANFSVPVPTPPSGDLYCPSQAVADPANHVAIAMQPANNQTFTSDGPPQVAAYTAASNGNLSTTNTSANMPSTDVVSVTSLNMAPSGKLLAVAGTGGLEVLHFNGADPATKYTHLLTNEEIDQIFWDNDNHLYAIGKAAGVLHVYTITPTSYREAPGSPYAISSPGNIIIQPWPLPWSSQRP
jgi:hypothetical protein